MQEWYDSFHYIRMWVMWVDETKSTFNNILLPRLLLQVKEEHFEVFYVGSERLQKTFSRQVNPIATSWPGGGQVGMRSICLVRRTYVYWIQLKSETKCLRVF